MLSAIYLAMRDAGFVASMHDHRAIHSCMLTYIRAGGAFGAFQEVSHD